MAKKQIDEDDDIENDFENDDNDVVDYQDDNSDDEVSDDDGDILDIEDDGDIDIVIEIDEDDLDLTDSENEVIADEETTESGDDIILSKHKIEGKHSLKYDSIFKGKKEDPVSEDDMNGFAAYYKETIEVDKSSIYHHESIDNETYVRGKLVKERVYQVLKENTTINFLNNRRKPSRVDFNCYYSLL